MARNSRAFRASGVARPHDAVGFVLSSMFVACAAGLLGNALVASPVVSDAMSGRESEVSDLTSKISDPNIQVSNRTSEISAPESEAPLHTADGASDLRWFDNRPIRPVRTMTMRVTAYSPDEQSCGEWADGITASGYSVRTNAGNLVAADTSILPFGSLVSVPGYDGGAVVPVLDRGGAIKGKRLDVLYPTHERALEWGVQYLEVIVWEYAD